MVVVFMIQEYGGIRLRERERIVVRFFIRKNKIEGNVFEFKILVQEVVWNICLFGIDVVNSYFVN